MHRQCDFKTTRPPSRPSPHVQIRNCISTVHSQITRQPSTQQGPTCIGLSEMKGEWLSCAKEIVCVLPQWLLPHCTHTYHHTIPVCLPPKLLIRGSHICCHPPVSDPPGQKEKHCKDAPHRLQFCIQHIHPIATYIKAEPAELEDFPQQPDPGFSDWKNPIHQDWQHHLKHYSAEHQCFQGLCAQSTAVHPANAWLCWSNHIIKSTAQITSSRLLLTPQLWDSSASAISQYTGQRWSSLPNSA